VCDRCLWALDAFERYRGLAPLRCPVACHFDEQLVLGCLCEPTEYTLGPLLGSATSPPTNLWVRREWLRSARSDTNPTYLPPSVVAHRATTLTTFVAVSVRKIHLHPATVMAALQLI
jgi:hypothetical protein